MKWNRVISGLALAGLVALIHGACSGKDKRPPVIVEPPQEGGSDVVVGATGGSGGMAGADGSAPANCGELVCRGHGKCVLDEQGIPHCVCDEHYVLEDDECVVDESCIEIRSLEEECRMVINGPPAVALFFAVDFCAGTAVLPDKIQELAGGFEVLENDIPISRNPESYAAVVPREVESYVTIAIDVSTSLTDRPDLLSPFTTVLRNFVTNLARPEDEPPVGVSILIFARNVAEYVPFTTNLSAVDAALQLLEDSPQTVQALVGGDGTSLRAAAKKGIEHTERIQKLRRLATQRGVLSTGTLVVVTDGRESGNTTLDQALIDRTLVNLISIGISDDIDDEDLTAIGRDGSFLAPTPADWAAAFDEIAQRVDDYPKRSYLLGYCSSATTGTPLVSVSLKDLEPAQTTSCQFNADWFSKEPSAVCNAEFLSGACAGAQCGGLLACGACAASECCTSAGTCAAPSKNTDDCRNQDELCLPTNERCAVISGTSPPQHECVAPAQLTEACGQASGGLCEAGVGFCLDEICQPVVSMKAPCANAMDRPEASRCPELNCSLENPGLVGSGYVCKPRARMFEVCSGQVGSAVCEPGAICKSETCQPRSLFECSSNSDCLSGVCNIQARRCVGTNFCHWSWDSKMSL